jgi:PAS domain S-box-containing protein
MPDALLAFSCLLPLLFLITIARKRTQLRVLKKALAAEALEKERVAQDLGALRNEFDRRVDERTLEISLANEVLQRAIEEERHASSLLREREQQFKLACHFGQVATWVWDLNTDEFLVSSSSPGKDGTAPCDHFFAIHNEDRHAVRLSFENARTCASEFGVEFRTLDVDDTVHWVAARGALELREDGPPLRMTGVSIDITARKEAELALAESEKQFEFLADSIPNLAWMAHADGHTFWYNRRWYEYTNTTPEQVSGWGWQSVHHPDELPRVMARWRECIRTGEPFEMEFPLLSGTGVFHWFLTRVTPVYGQEGEIARWFGTNTDVTEIRHAREALRESESHFRQIANSLPQLVWIAGPDGSVQWLNQRWYDFTGSTAEQSEGDGWMQFTHPEDHAWRAENWTHSFSTAALFESESRCRRSDGVYRWFLIRGNPVVGTHGQIVKWFGTYTDVEDYKRAETEIRRLNQGLENRVVERTAELLQANEELRRTQTWLRAVLDSATQASIIAVDNQGIITLFNSGAEKLLGYSARELVGTRAPQIFQTTGTRELPDRPHSSEQPRPAVARLGNPGTDPDGASVFESVYFHRDGTPIEVGVAHTPMVDSHGERLGTLGIALDIRPRKALERRLNQNNIELKEQTRSAQDANRAKSDFLAVMSHEFRTPMNAILGMADLLWESDLEPTQRQYVEVFRRAGANLLTLVNRVRPIRARTD